MCLKGSSLGSDACNKAPDIIGELSDSHVKRTVSCIKLNRACLLTSLFRDICNVCQYII